MVPSSSITSFCLWHACLQYHPRKLIPKTNAKDQVICGSTRDEKAVGQASYELSGPKKFVFHFYPIQEEMRCYAFGKWIKISAVTAKVYTVLFCHHDTNENFRRWAKTENHRCLVLWPDLWGLVGSQPQLNDNIHHMVFIYSQNVLFWTMRPLQGANYIHAYSTWTVGWTGVSFISHLQSSELNDHTFPLSCRRITQLSKTSSPNQHVLKYKQRNQFQPLREGITKCPKAKMLPSCFAITVSSVGVYGV